MEINHNPSDLFLSREDEDEVRDIGNTIFVRFYFSLCYLMLIGKVINLSSLCPMEIWNLSSLCPMEIWVAE